MEQLTTAKRNKLAATYGLILGLANVLTSTIMYSMAGNMMMAGVVGIGTLVVIIALMFIFAAQIRKANGGFMEFRAMFGAMFVMVLVSTAISYTYGLVYQNYIDPNYATKAKEGMMQMFDKMGASDNEKVQEQLDKSMADFDKKMQEAKSFSPKILATTIAMALVLALIVAAIMKKKRPIFEDNFDLKG